MVNDTVPRSGGNFAVGLFALTLIAFVVESQLTQVFSSEARCDHKNLTIPVCSSTFRPYCIIGNLCFYCTSSLPHEPALACIHLDTHQLHRPLVIRDHISPPFRIPYLDYKLFNI